MKTFGILLVAVLFAVNTVKSQSLSKYEADRILREHNAWRAELGIPGLTWSDELAQEAQKWANYLASSGCNLIHSKTNNGENLYWSSDYTPPEDVVDYWASEKEYFKRNIFERNNEYGHYTQIIWRNTKSVGCAKATCKNGGEMWVCQYYPAGNWIGEKVY